MMLKNKSQSEYDKLILAISQLQIENINGKYDARIKELKDKLLKEYGVDFDSIFN